MGHYRVEAWLDYVSGCVPEEARGQMSRHASGCERCGRLLHGLQALRATLIADRRDGVPDDVAESAASLFKTPRDARRPHKPDRTGGD